MESVAISFSRRSLGPRDFASLTSPALAGRFFTTESPGKPLFLKEIENISAQTLFKRRSSIIKLDQKYDSCVHLQFHVFFKLVLEERWGGIRRKGKESSDPKRQKLMERKKSREDADKGRNGEQRRKEPTQYVLRWVLVDLFGFQRVNWSSAMLINWFVIAHNFYFLTLNLRFSALSTHCNHMELKKKKYPCLDLTPEILFYLIWVHPAIVVFKSFPGWI